MLCSLLCCSLYPGKSFELDVPALSTNQFIAQQNPNTITPDDAFSTLSSINSLGNKSPVVVNPTSPEIYDERMEGTCSSTDIFSQIGNLVKPNQTSINKQLPSTTSNRKDDFSLPISPVKTNNSLKRSEEASSIISAFPLLDFMRSSVLMFPLESDSLKPTDISYHNVGKDDISPNKMKVTGDCSSIFTTEDIGPNNCNLYSLNINGDAIKYNNQS